jgi:lysozyme
MDNRTKATTLAIIAAITLAEPVVKESEGLALTGYYDPIRIPTECYGHTAGAIVGRVSTVERCELLLRGDLLIANKGVRSVLKVELDPHIEAAMTSFTYNAGVGNFSSSTMLKMLNARDFKGACAQLSRWVYAGDRIFSGLVKRRAKERALCEQGLNPAPKKIAFNDDDRTLGRRRAGGARHDLELKA